jgi:hypothetical protein
MSLQSLTAYACLRDGIFNRFEAHHHDLTDARLRGLLRRGVIEELHPNVFHFCVVAMTPRALVRAAVTAGGGCAVAGYSSALLLLGVDDAPRGRPEIILRGTVAPDLEGVRCHRSRHLPDDDVITIDGIPTTAGSRTVIDMSQRLSEPDLIDLVDRCICARVAARSVLHTRACMLRNGRAGVATVAKITAPEADGEFWSALERLFGARVAASDLPQPSFNAPLRHRGRLIIVDALWPDLGLVVELYGLKFHSLRPHHLRDNERQNVLTQLRLRSLVFGWRDVQEHFDTVAADIRAALR